jgi:nicotinamidase-related amidase
MDGQGLARRSSAREPLSQENCFYPLHSARASRPDAGHVAALLHAPARCDPRAPGSPAAGVDAAAGGDTVIDKNRYSAFAEPRLIEHLRQRETDALIVSGSETDVCVLATVLDAVDIGYRVIVVRDAVCSSSVRQRSRHAHAALRHPIYGADRYRRRRDNPRAVGMTSDRTSSRLGVLIDLV